MTIGMLGDVIFQTGDAVRAIESFDWEGSINVATHSVHLGNAVTEYTGRGPDKISLDITLTRDLGVEPMDEMTKLWTYMRNAEPVPFTLGTHAYGRYRWIIQSMSNALKYFDRNGDVQYCNVKLELIEYLKG